MRSINESISLYQIQLNLKILQFDFSELISQFDSLHNIENAQRIYRLNIEEIDNIIVNITRLLWNYLSLAKAVVDVNRVLINKAYKEDKFLVTYQNEIKTRFQDNAVVGFLEGLRNYSLHYAQPMGNLKPIYKDLSNKTIVNFEFILKKRKLLEWREWGRKGKKFIESSNDDIYIDPIIRKYNGEILDFYSWLSKNFPNE